MLKSLIILIVKIYQGVISPLLARRCRFHPSCSQYAIDSLEIHGAFIGIFYAIWRIVRCNPYNPGGYDPVVKEK